MQDGIWVRGGAFEWTILLSEYSNQAVWQCLASYVRHIGGWLLLIIFSASVSLALDKGLISPELLAKARATYGDKVQLILQDWAELLSVSEPSKDMQKLKSINQYFNQRITFKSDLEHWKKEDYWATPIETLGTEGGDCEDYVIAKYFSLIQAGIKQEKLRITYVKALKLNQAHMVLAYYAKPRSEPLILDNLIDAIKPASQRPDLAPVYSFNGLGMWLERMRGNSIKVGNPNRLNMWVDLLLRMEEQGLKGLLHVPAK